MNTTVQTLRKLFCVGTAAFLLSFGITSKADSDVPAVGMAQKPVLQAQEKTPPCKHDDVQMGNKRPCKSENNMSDKPRCKNCQGASNGTKCPCKCPCKDKGAAAAKAPCPPSGARPAGRQQFGGFNADSPVASLLNP